MSSRFDPRILAVTAILAAGLLAGCDDDDDSTTAADTATEAPAPKPAFSYSGATGPEHWGSIDPSYATCDDGKSQSPIDLKNGKVSTQDLTVSYRPGEVEQVNNGHSIETEYHPGSSITLDGTEYQLIQSHFHAPSEHLIDGKEFPLEFHFVNMADDGSLAVLGVMVTEGKENPAFTPLADALPAQEDETQPVDGEVDPADLLPPDPDAAVRWFYDGSLTTPPCSEGVRWTVYNQPIEMSADQIAAYQALYDQTARPAQPLNGREVDVTAQP